MFFAIGSPPILAGDSNPFLLNLPAVLDKVSPLLQTEDSVFNVLPDWFRRFLLVMLYSIW
jgi:hypothetical protein